MGGDDLCSHFSLLSAVVPDPKSLTLVLLSLLRPNGQTFSPEFLLEQMNKACREAAVLWACCGLPRTKLGQRM